MTVTEVNYKWNGSLTKRKKTTKLILHHAAAKTCSAEDIHRWHLANGWTGIGYHYFVRKDGSVYRGRPENTVGAHALRSNSFSIGVCFEGNFETETMPEAQLKAGQELVADICARYSLSKSDILGHRNVNATACPGKNFPFDEIISRVGAAPAESEKPETNRVLEFQNAAVADGFTFPKFGTDGYWGTECESVAKRCIIRRREHYTYKNATRLVQELIGIKADGLCGHDTEAAIKDFQQKSGLSADGECGINTWKKLLGV